jgi:hypothetical protein
MHEHDIAEIRRLLEEQAIILGAIMAAIDDLTAAVTANTEATAAAVAALNADSNTAAVVSATAAITKNTSDLNAAVAAANPPPPPTLPAVTGVSPDTGSVAGGESISLTGTGFTGAISVSFGTVAAVSFTVGSDTSVTAVAPAVTTAGTVDITVVTPAGTSATSISDQYTTA